MTGQFHEAEYLAKEIFGNQRRGFFIEAGAFEGETLSNTLYFEATKVFLQNYYHLIWIFVFRGHSNNTGHFFGLS
jgi:hypothetical protein